MKISKKIGLMIYVLFFISGFTGLVYEVVWTRMLTSVFGSTTYAVSSVLSAFMGGLAVGSYFIGKYIEKIEKQILTYAYIEFGIGAIALIIPFIFHLLDKIYPVIFQSSGSQTWILILIKVVLSLIVLIIPTFLMGGTLPVLCKLFINSTNESGKKVGVLYAINTFGAALGCFITGFFLIESFGINKTNQIVAVINILIGISFVIINSYHESETNRQLKIEIEKPIEKVNDSDLLLTPFYSKLILTAFFLSGFISLSYEVLWTRLLVFKLKMTIYAFSIMLSTFLTGIGIGSIIVSILEKYKLIKNHSKTFGIIQMLIGLIGLSTIFLFSKIDSIELFNSIGFFKATSSWKKLIFSEILLSSMIMIVPTMLMGMTFPIVSRIFTKNIKIVGKTIGSIYSLNTVGCILGSSITGFLFVKIFGTQKSIILVSFLTIFIGFLLLIFNNSGIKSNQKFKKSQLMFPILICGFAIATVLWLPKDILFNYYNIFEKQSFKDAKIIYANEGIECITTVHKYKGGFKGISTSSVNVAGTHYTHRTTQKLQAHVPLLVHQNPKEVLQIGFGSGETSHIVTSYDIDRLDLVEISSEVIKTSTEYFSEINKKVANHPKFHPIIMDGANYIKLTNKKYDLILNDASWPGYTGCSALYSKDYFENAKKRLKPGGIMTSWFPIVEGEEFKTLIKTFHSVFPHVSVWLSMTHVNKHALVVGSENEMKINAGKFLERFEKFAKNDLKSVDLDNPVFFLDAYQMDETSIGNIFDKISIHTIDHPVLEFNERKNDPIGNITAVKIVLNNNSSVIHNLTNYEQIKINGKDFVESIENARKATKLVMKGYIKVITPGEYKPKFKSEFKEALKISPDNPGANNFFFRMFNIHMQLADKYRKENQQKYATYCTRLAYKEMDFYTDHHPESGKPYYFRGKILLNGGNYLGLNKEQSIQLAKQQFIKAVSLNPNYFQNEIVNSLISLKNN